MDFCQLQERLLLHLRTRLRRGETTERQLARTTGISQPHMHNILKGARDLTPTTSDRILHALGVDLTDLIEAEELERSLLFRSIQGPPGRELPVLASRIGLGGRWPAEESRFERLAVPIECLGGMRHPVAARLSEDPAMMGAFEASDLAVVDLAGIPPADSVPGTLYLIVPEGEPMVRWLRAGRDRVYMVSAMELLRPERWPYLETRSGEPHTAFSVRLLRDVIPAAVIPRKRPGMSLTPARHSVAS